MGKNQGKKGCEGGEKDEVVYTIILSDFTSKTYFDALGVDIEGNVMPHVPRMSMKKAVLLQVIELSFRSMADLDTFKEQLPFGYSSTSDSFRFVEMRRNKRTKKWEAVDDPLLGQVE